MKVAKYIDDRIKSMLNNPHSTQGYPRTAEGNPCTLQDPSITPINSIIYGNSIEGTQGVGDKILPDEYQQIEYIESTGTQYIDTGYSPNANTVLETELQYTIDLLSAPNREYLNGLSGFVSPNNSRFAYGYSRAVTSDYFYIGISNVNISTFVAADANKHKFIIRANGSWQIDDRIGSQDVTEFSSQGTLYVFARNVNGINSPSHLRVYSYKLYEADKLVKNFIPCYRKSDNVIGMYDLVDSMFYMNEGTGSFLKGENKTTYKIPIKTSGKNLLPIKTSGENTANNITLEYNSDGSIYVNSGTSTNTVVYNFMPSTYGSKRFKLNLSGTLTISMPGGINNKIFLVMGRYRDGNVVYIDTRIGSAKISVEETDEFVVYIQIAKQVTLPETTLYPQIELNSTATPWEPYFTPQTVNLYLDEPLRKAGENADYIDWRKGVIKRFASESSTEMPIVLPKLPFQPHLTNYISVDTAVKGDLTVKYHSFTKEE